MQTEAERAQRARELAQWFRAMAADGAREAGDDLMARTAAVLERVAEAPAPQTPVAVNDNVKAKASRKRNRR